MASRGRKIDNHYAIEFIRELLGRPDASEEEIMGLAQQALSKVDGNRVTVDLEVSSMVNNGPLRKVLELLLKQNNTKEGDK